MSALGFLGRIAGTLAYGAVKSTAMAGMRQTGLFNPYSEAKRFFGWQDAAKATSPVNNDAADELESLQGVMDNSTAGIFVDGFGIASVDTAITDMASSSYDPFGMFGAPDF